jgi:hypothetical protein
MESSARQSWQILSLLVAMGVLLGMATLMHQQNILMVAPTLVALPVAVRGGRQLATIAGSFLTAHGVVAILPYLAVARAVLGLRTIPDMHQWIIGLAGWGLWGQWTHRTIFSAGVGLLRSFMGSQFLLRLDPVRSFAHSHGAWVQDKLPVADAVPPVLCAVLAVLALSALVLGVIAVARSAGNLSPPGSRHASLTASAASGPKPCPRRTRRRPSRPRFGLDERVPIRADIDLRRITRKRT